MPSCKVQRDPISEALASQFDLSWDGTSCFEPPSLGTVPENFGIGLIVGPSGTGKSLLLQTFGSPDNLTWNTDRSIASHFDDPTQAQDRLTAVGLNSVPDWLKPYHVLSTGEKFRADMARQLRSGAVIDEFTSTVDRKVATSLSIAIRRRVDLDNLKNIVLATCHFDVIRPLEPDWIFNTISGVLDSGRRVPRVPMVLQVHRCGYKFWELFRDHHYLTSRIHTGSQCYLGLLDQTPAVFTAVIPFPHPKIKRGSREHRTVVLPDFQGCGIGPRFSDAVASLYRRAGRRFFSRTSHPRFGKYREDSQHWRPTASNLKKQTPQKELTSISDHWAPDPNRICYSHEYIGPPSK